MPSTPPPPSSPSSDDTPSTTRSGGTWAELLSAEHRSAVTVFAGGITVFAVNTYLTAASLPSAVADIGGQRLYAWVMTVFLITAVLASMLVTRALAQWGARTAYLVAFGTFGLGSLVCALAPTMPIMLVGRAVQGLGGGLLTGLAFTVIRIALPERLWVRGVGLTSAMWGVGNLIGPVLGGFFGQIGFWRGAFWVLVAATAVIAILAARALPAGRAGADTRPDPLPLPSLALVLAATVTVSIASIVDGIVPMGILVATAAGILILFVAVDRSRTIRLLPHLVYTSGSPLKWIYLAIAILAIGSTSETFIPLFGQEIAGMAPLIAGLLGAAISWGWSIAQLSSTTWAHGRRSAVVRVAGPAFLATGLAGYGLLQGSSTPAAIAGWFAVLVVAGTGIGMAFPHFATAAMTITTDDAEAARASAGVNTVQMVANTLGSALAGLLVSVGAAVHDGSVVASARYLSFGFAALAAVGVGVAVASLRRPAQPPAPPGAVSDSARPATDVGRTHE
ncbi:MFS transporter [Gordonia sinesedis]